MHVVQQNMKTTRLFQNLTTYKLFILSVVGCIRESSGFCPASCSCSSTAVACTSGLPTWLPKDTKSVTLDNIGNNRLSKFSFIHDSWEQVQVLIVKERANAIEPHVTVIDNDAFANLRSLSVLKISCHFLTDIYYGSFSGLNKLQVLDLSDSGQMGDNNLWVVLSGILKQKNTLSNLQVLNLANVSPKHNELFLDDETLRAFNSRPVKELNLSKVPIKVLDIISLQQNLPQLEILNVSSTVLSYLTDIDIVRDSGLQPFSNLRILDMSNCLTILPRFSTTGKQLVFAGVDILQTIEEVYISGLLSAFDFRFTGATIEFIPHNVKMSLKKSDMSNSGYHWVNITSVYGTDFCASLEHLNFSRNNLEYVNPALGKTCSLLQVFDLSRNKLHIMSEYQEFSLLFKHLKNIQIIYLSHNSLKNIPIHMFASNDQLRVLDLSQNQLEYVHFNISHLHKLSSLNLRSNAIKYIDSTSKDILNSLYWNQLDDGQTGYGLQMAENPFLCSCEHVDSVTFLVRTSLVIFDRKDMRCMLDGRSSLLNEETNSKTLYLCKRDVIIAAIVTCSSMFLIGFVVCLTMFTRWRRSRSEANRMKRLVERYQEDRLNDLFRTEDFLVFLCYCSEDEAFVEKNIRHQLLQTLQEILKTQRELVSDGDTHFEAGRLIIDNIAKHVATSKVIVCIVSKAFCRSEWCNYEAKMSLFSSKPTILMFKEEVPQRLMWKELKCLYQKYARAFWKEQAPGEFVLKPNLIRICKMICELGDYKESYGGHSNGYV